MIKLAIGITMCYLAVSIVLTTKDDLRLVIPYVEFAKQVRGVRPLLLDTSSADRRPHGWHRAERALDALLVLPQFVIEELQSLADSSDKLKRPAAGAACRWSANCRRTPCRHLDRHRRHAAPAVDQMLVQMAANRTCGSSRPTTT